MVDGTEATVSTAAEQATLRDFWLVSDQHFDQIAPDVQKDVAQYPDLASFLALGDPAEKRQNHEFIRRTIVPADNAGIICACY